MNREDRAAVPDSRGTYALMLRCGRARSVIVGSLGVLPLLPGVYLYVGSAFGPGGLRARLSRHAACGKIKRWHIDYVRMRMSLVGAWFSTAPQHLEHDWAERVLVLPGATNPMPRFGASDCSCASHFVRFSDYGSSHPSIAAALTDVAPDLGYLEAGLLRGLARRGCVSDNGKGLRERY